MIRNRRTSSERRHGTGRDLWKASEAERISSRQNRAAWERGFTLIELMIVVAVIGIVSAIAIPLYGSMTTQARVAKARGDLRTLASAISMYQAHVGALPASLAQLTTVVSNPQGVSAGPFLATVPNPPPGGSPMWTAYEAGYTTTTEGGFSVSATGDGVSVTVP